MVGVYRKIQEAVTAAKILNVDVELSAPSRYRIVVRTDASKELSEQGLRNVAKHMSHSTETARQYYEFSNITDAVNAHDTIVEMAKRRKWNDKETDILLQAWSLEKGRPDLKTCAAIKEEYQLKRTPKNIQDKWRQLYSKH